MKAIWMILPLMLLAACVPMETPTNDLYADAQSSRATMIVAEQDLTSTAGAPITNITETAAALIVAQTKNSIDGTSTAILWTPTPSQTPTITPTPTPNATATLTFAQLEADRQKIFNDTQRDNLELERQRSMNTFWAVLPGIVFAIVAVVLILGLIWLARREQFRPVPVDPRGNLLPIMDYVNGTVTDVDRAPNYLSGTTRKDLPALPAVTSSRQDGVTERDQTVDLITRGLPSSGASQPERKKIVQQHAAALGAGTNLQNRFRLLSDGSGLDIIDAEIIQTLDNDWKETR